MTLFKKEEPKIRFVSTVPGLSSMEDCRPRPSNKFIPQWWKDTPIKRASHSVDSSTLANVRSCPSFNDYFSTGYIIPMWSDTILKYSSDSDHYSWKSASDLFTWEVHSNDQFLDSVTYKHLNLPGKFVFKPISPWMIITPPGYSVYQLPLYFHVDNQFTIVPGVLDTDRWHVANPQLVLLTEEEVFIAKGTPLVQYVPFKRDDKLALKVLDATKKEINLFNKKHIDFSTQFRGTHYYQKTRKKESSNNE